ncbi:hypothetical protein [uncultured Desulfobacter sp.]|uniref:hypothetical protein n=1 Tax=uncultured Desulfobacter sp. TaxID=240139 RepID=UPI0029F5485B|nr:hypothetical protein [uncultured Desulfobacter sp.]
MALAAEKMSDDKEKKVVPMANIPMGLSVKGLIMEKISGTTAKGDETFHLAVAVKGLEKFLKIKVSKEIFDNSTEMTPYHNSISFQEFNGRVYWQESD